jgi:hypothetical protein
LKIVIILFIIWPILIFGQSRTSFLNGFCLEVGGGQNNLFWSPDFSVMTQIRTFGLDAVDRTNFKFAPNFRLSYQYKYKPSFLITPFVGYNQIGGYSKDDSYIFKAVEIGTFALYKISNFSLGIGTKVSFFINTEYKLYDSVWDHSDWFSNQTGDIGLRTSYSIRPFLLSLESWFGLLNLGKGILEKANIHQNHYRILIGYLF